jgi:glycosyltransferase involved in cell wall biosynthesis
MKGGVERALIQQLRGFDRTQVKLTLLITFQFPELEVLLPEIPKDVQIIHIINKKHLNSTRIKKAMNNLNFFLRLYDEFLQIPRTFYSKKRLRSLFPQFDVIVDFDVTLGSYLADFCGPKIGWFHFSVKNYHEGNARRLKRLGKKLAKYDKVVMISDQMLAEAQSMYPEIRDRFIRIYNGFDFEGLKNRGSDLSQLGHLERELLNEKYIFSAGRFDERQKDFTTLIQAYAKVAHQIPHQLMIAGEGPDQMSLEQLVASLNIQDKVKFLGFQSNPLPFVKNCDFFVHSSKFEGLPTVILEALAFNKTVIASDCPTGPREILDSDKYGYLFKVGDIEALATQIKKLADGSSARIGSEQIQAHLKNFDIRNIQNELFKIKGIAEL